MSLLNPLYDAVAWVLQQIHTGLTLVGLGSDSGVIWLLAIVLLVALMRLILVPLFIKQMHATRKMAALAPQLQELRKKYKNDKETLNQETMRLYRENGANPLAGCLPLVAQMPVFFALFSVLRGIAEWNATKPLPYGLSEHTVVSAQKADIFGATIADKVLFSPGTPVHAKVVIVIFVLVSATTTFMTVRQSTKRGMTPQMTPDNPMASSQKIMQYVVPLFALSGLYWQFGLVIYWVTTNLWTLGQQYVLFKRYPTPVPAGAAAGAAAGGAGKPAGGDSAGKKPGAAAAGGARPGGAGGAKGRDESAANGSGFLGRLSKGRSVQEPQPAPAEVKLVRQQRVRQPRSKRSGKR